MRGCVAFFNSAGEEKHSESLPKAALEQLQVSSKVHACQSPHINSVENVEVECHAASIQPALFGCVYDPIPNASIT